MKNIFLSICLLLPFSLSALPVGNPADANMLCQGVFWPGRFDFCDCLRWTDLFSVRVGYYGDYVFDRKMEVDAPNRNASLRKTKICTNAGYIVLNFYDRIEVYAAPGVTSFKVETPQSAFNIVDDGNALYYLNTETKFSYTVGGDASIFHIGRLVFGVDGKYFYTRPKLKSVRVEIGSVEYPRAHLKYKEWQVSAGLSYIVPISCWIDVLPYGTVKWAQAKGDFEQKQDVSQTHTFFDLKNTRRIGYAVGISLAGCAKWELTVEGRFYDELAFDFNTQFRF